MEIELNILVFFLASAFFIGVALPILIAWYRNKSPEIMSTGRLNTLGLPLNDKRYSHIFKHEKEKRITVAKGLLEELRPRLKEDEKKIQRAKDKMNDIQIDMNVEQQRIREMQTIGEERAFMKTHLTTFLADLRMEGERLGAALSSKTMLSQQILFAEQVEQGHERKVVDGILKGSPFKSVSTNMLVDQAVKAFKDALDLDADVARDVRKDWIETKR